MAILKKIDKTKIPGADSKDFIIPKTQGAGSMNCIIPETKNVLKNLIKKYDLTPVEKEALDATFKALDIIESLKRNQLKFRKYKVYEEENNMEYLYYDDKETCMFLEVTKAAILNLDVESARFINDHLLDFYL